MTQSSPEVQNLEDMLRGAKLVRAQAGKKPYPEADKLIGTIEDEIYYQQQREKENARDEVAFTADTFSPGATSKHDSTDVDGLHVLKVGNRSTTFRINGKLVTLGEFRSAAKKKGVEIEKRLKLDDKPERFVSRGEVRVEQ